jgi:hypothetical protein
MRLSAILTVSIFTVFSASYAQQKSISAVRTNQYFKIDGNLDEADWKTAPEATDFITYNPVAGKPSSQKTIVKILYDNYAIYVGGYFYDDPGKVRKQLATRDLTSVDADFFLMGFDTYQDRQNAFIFKISAAGVQSDYKQSQNGSTNGGVVADFSWDAVWESMVSIKKDGWVAEIRIPYSALRFPKKDVQDWGLNFARLIRRKGELSIWSPEDPNISGDVNQWGNLNGLKNIVPPLRLSLSPYLSGGFRTSPTNDSKITETLKSGGMDVKYGINESFTLDMTLIPDFAQVQSDNTFLNLSPFEVKFDDYRPFFTEGTELFNKAGLFYSRRIGNRPKGADDILNLSPAYHIDKNPGITRLYNATKFSGRNKNNLGIGVFNAVSAPMYAKLVNKTTGADSSALTEPLTNYNIIVFDKILKNRSSVSFTNTNVLRKGNNRNANVSSVDLSLFDKKNRYNFLFTTRYSNIWGKDGSTQGYTTVTGLNKVSGLWRYGAGGGIESDQYDPNDLGFNLNNNSYNVYASAGYFKNQPVKNVLQHNYTLKLENNYLYKPFHWTDLNITASTYFQFRNLWDISAVFNTRPLWYNDFFEPRTAGKVLKRAPYYYLNVSGGTDSRKKFLLRYGAGFAESPLPDDPLWSGSLSLRYRFNNRFLVSSSYDATLDKGSWGYSYRNLADPVIARRNVKKNTFIFAAQYGFTQKMNWTVRLRHNWTYLENTNFYTLKNDGYWNEIAFSNGRNRNTNFFNIDMFYTWDFLPGSRITVAWKNAIGGNVALDAYQNTRYFKNLNNMFDNPHSNEITLKVVYYLDYLTLQHRK